MAHATVNFVEREQASFPRNHLTSGFARVHPKNAQLNLQFPTAECLIKIRFGVMNFYTAACFLHHLLLMNITVHFTCGFYALFKFKHMRAIYLK